MPHLASKLPPLRSLVAFEASARQLSLTRAAGELKISREAVSRHIRTLEDHLGVKLFYRVHRAVALTSSGRKFQSIVRESLENIATGAEAILGRTRSSGINVSSTIALASFWLTPRLASFREKHANVEIHVKISDAPTDMIADGIDIALRYGDGKWKGLTKKRLFGVKSFPVCSPEYLKRAGAITQPVDLLKHTLINLDGAVHVAEDWRWWLTGIGVDVPRSLMTLGFDSYANVIQAALDGQGVALGFSGLASDLIAGGRLVRPIDSELNPGFAVYLVSPMGMKPTPAVNSFVSWIIGEAAKSNRAIARFHTRRTLPAARQTPNP
jgi:LysR family glycine cleavage system transcriptional activator